MFFSFRVRPFFLKLISVLRILLILTGLNYFLVLFLLDFWSFLRILNQCFHYFGCTVMSKKHLGRTHTPEVRSQVVEPTVTHGTPHLREESPATWSRRRSRATTQTTHRRLLSRNSTAPHDKEATTQMSMRAWSQRLAPLTLLRHTKMSAMQNQTESWAKNIIRVTKKGTGTRKRWAAIEEVLKEKSPVWRALYRNCQNRTRSPPRMNVRWKRRRKKRKVNVQYVLG